jgi:hypothetical protein
LVAGFADDGDGGGGGDQDQCWGVGVGASDAALVQARATLLTSWSVSAC